jgi:hypothetical protein
MMFKNMLSMFPSPLMGEGEGEGENNDIIPSPLTGEG